MVTRDMKRIAKARRLFVLDPAVLGLAAAWSGRVAVLGGGGITVGTMTPTGDGRWVSVPGTFPSKVGGAAEVLDFLAQFSSIQTFAVSVGFDRGQVAALEENEDTILHALKGVAHQLVGGKVEGILVGSACWDR